MNEQKLLELVKEKLIEALNLASTENIPINKLIFAYTMLKRLELDMQDNKDEQDTIIVKYIDELAK